MRIDTIVVSTQHSPDVSQATIREFVIRQIVEPLLPPAMVDGEIKYHVNPTGRFVTGGPKGDCGLTGRKIIVDTYGGWGRHGGGAFSGKDPTKVDRSASYMARHMAKNIVAAKLAERCEVQIAYAIGVSEPVSVNVNTDGTGVVDDERICEVVRDFFPLTPGGIISYLKLRRPIYRQTAAGGHFGRNEPEFTWEKTDRAAALAEACGVQAVGQQVGDFGTEVDTLDSRRSRTENRLMVASAAARERVHTLRLPRSVASLGPIVLVAFTWMMLVVAAWLCIRHLAGKLQQPLGFAPLLAVGLVSAAAVSALRCGWWRTGLWPARRWSLAHRPVAAAHAGRAAAGGGVVHPRDVDRCLVRAVGHPVAQ